MSTMMMIRPTDLPFVPSLGKLPCSPGPARDELIRRERVFLEWQVAMRRRIPVGDVEVGLPHPSEWEPVLPGWENVRFKLHHTR